MVIKKVGNHIGKLIGICKKSPESGRNFLYKKFSICTIFRDYIFEKYYFLRLCFRNVLFFEHPFSKFFTFLKTHFLDKCILDKSLQSFATTRLQSFEIFVKSFANIRILSFEITRKVSQLLC